MRLGGTNEAAHAAAEAAPSEGSDDQDGFVLLSNEKLEDFVMVDSSLDSLSKAAHPDEAVAKDLIATSPCDLSPTASSATTSTPLNPPRRPRVSSPIPIPLPNKRWQLPPGGSRVAGGQGGTSPSHADLVAQARAGEPPRLASCGTSAAAGMEPLRKPFIAPVTSNTARRVDSQQALLPRLPVEVPALPPHYVEPSEVLQSAVQELLRFGGEPISISGASGAGKTVLASAIVRDTRVRRCFRGGITWMTAGQAVTGEGAEDWLHALLQAAERTRPAAQLAVAGPLGTPSAGVAPRSVRFRQALLRLSSVDGGPQQLLVIDDVWDDRVIVELALTGVRVLATRSSEERSPMSHQANAFFPSAKTLHSDEPCRGYRFGQEPAAYPHLQELGAKKAKTLKASGKKRREVTEHGSLTSLEAVRVLLRAGDSSKIAATAMEEGTLGALLLKVAALCCDSSPVALAIISSLEDLEGEDRRRTGVWRRIEQRLYGDDVETVPEDVCRPDPLSRGAGSISFDRVVDISVRELDPVSMECFFRLGVLAEGTVVPFCMLSNLWDQSMADTERTISKLLKKVLLQEVYPRSRCYRVHSCVLACIRRALLPLAIVDGGVRRIEAPSTLRTAADRQVEYLGKVDTLFRYASCGQAGGERTALDSREELLGGLRSLNVLWRTAEELHSRAQGLRPPEISSVLGPETYTSGLIAMGVCVKASTGFWAAGKLQASRDNLEVAKMFAERSVHLSNILYNALEDDVRALVGETTTSGTTQRTKEETVWVECVYKERLRMLVVDTGSHHPAIASVRASLGAFLAKQGETVRALHHFQEALRLLEGCFGDDHPRLLLLLVDIAETILAQIMSQDEGSRVAASSSPPLASVCSWALAIYDLTRKMSVRSSRGAATALVRLADVFREREEWAVAQNLYRSALASLRQQLGACHVQVSSVLVSLADLLVAQVMGTTSASMKESTSEAIKLYRQAIVQGVRRLGPTHEKVAGWRSKLARALSDQRHYVEAAAQYLQIIDVGKPPLGADHSCIISIARQELNRLVDQCNYDRLLEMMTSMTCNDRPAEAVCDVSPPSPPPPAVAAAAADATRSTPLIVTPRTIAYAVSMACVADEGTLASDAAEVPGNTATTRPAGALGGATNSEEVVRSAGGGEQLGFVYAYSEAAAFASTGLPVASATPVHTEDPPQPVPDDGAIRQEFLDRKPNEGEGSEGGDEAWGPCAKQERMALDAAVMHLHANHPRTFDQDLVGTSSFDALQTINYDEHEEMDDLDLMRAIALSLAS